MTDDLPPLSRSAQADPVAFRIAGLAALTAPVLFTASLIGFAQLRTDGYTHGTKAVSELGAVGAPNATAFNLLAYVTPGMLMLVVAIILARTTGTARGMAMLGLAGLVFASTGVFPYDMAEPASFTSQAHYAGVMLAGLFWALAVFRSSATLTAAGQPGLARHGRWLVLLLLANIAWQAAYQSGAPILPGWGQRLGFAGMMIWLMLIGIGTLRASRRSTEARG